MCIHHISIVIASYCIRFFVHVVAGAAVGAVVVVVILIHFLVIFYRRKKGDGDLESKEFETCCFTWKPKQDVETADGPIQPIETIEMKRQEIYASPNMHMRFYTGVTILPLRKIPGHNGSMMSKVSGENALTDDGSLSTVLDIHNGEEESPSDTCLSQPGPRYSLLFFVDRPIYISDTFLFLTPIIISDSQQRWSSVLVCLNIVGDESHHDQHHDRHYIKVVDCYQCSTYLYDHRIYIFIRSQTSSFEIQKMFNGYGSKPIYYTQDTMSSILGCTSSQCNHNHSTTMTEEQNKDHSIRKQLRKHRKRGDTCRQRFVGNRRECTSV